MRTFAEIHLGPQLALTPAAQAGPVRPVGQDVEVQHPVQIARPQDRPIEQYRRRILFRRQSLGEGLHGLRNRRGQVARGQIDQGLGHAVTKVTVGP